MSLYIKYISLEGAPQKKLMHEFWIRLLRKGNKAPVKEQSLTEMSRDEKVITYSSLPSPSLERLSYHQKAADITHSNILFSSLLGKSTP